MHGKEELEDGTLNGTTDDSSRDAELLASLEDGGSDDDDLADLDIDEGGLEFDEGSGGGDGDDAEGDSPRTVPYTRLQKVIAQRNRLRAERENLAREAAELRGKADGLGEFQKILTDRYERFGNPAGQLAADADFMEALERLAPTDPEVNTFYKKVLQFMETGTPAAPARKSEPAKPEADPRIAKLIERQNAQTVAETLEPFGFQPKYLKLLQKHIAQAQDPSVDLDAAAVKEHTRKFLKDTGFTLAEMRAAAREDTTVATESGKPQKPASRSRAASAGNPFSKQDTADSSQELSRDEVLRRREKLLDSVIAELGGI